MDCGFIVIIFASFISPILLLIRFSRWFRIGCCKKNTRSRQGRCGAAVVGKVGRDQARMINNRMLTKNTTRRRNKRGENSTQAPMICMTYCHHAGRTSLPAAATVGRVSHFRFDHLSLPPSLRSLISCRRQSTTQQYLIDFLLFHNSLVLRKNCVAFWLKVPADNRQQQVTKRQSEGQTKSAAQVKDWPPV